MTGSVDNIFTHIQGGQCTCYSCTASQLAEVIADRGVIMDESIEQAGRIAALEARCRELLNEYDHGRDRARDLETDLANKQDRIAKLEESIRRYIADFKEPNTNMLSIAGLESALETTANECGCTIGSDK